LVETILNVPAIAIFGEKKSGKTSLIEAIIRRLTDKGFKVGYVKHIPHPDFTIDKEGKDSWRAAKAGAKIIICVSPKEVSTIRKNSSFDNSFKTIINLIEKMEEVKSHVDFLIFEGFRRLLKDDEEIPKIIVISEDRNLKFIEEFKNVWGIVTPKTLQIRKLPHNIKILSFSEIEDVLNFVEEKVRFFSILKKHPMLNCGLCGFKNCFEHAKAVYEGRIDIDSCVALGKGIATIKIDGKNVPLNKFTSEVVRRTVLGLISTLKDVNIKGNEIVEINLKRIQEKFS